MDGMYRIVVRHPPPTFSCIRQLSQIKLMCIAQGPGARHGAGPHPLFHKLSLNPLFNRLGHPFQNDLSHTMEYYTYH